MPHIGPDVHLDRPAFIHESANLFGRVNLAPDVSIWPNVVMRAEIFDITIGSRSNIQDFVMIHVGFETPTIVGEDCSITHHATLHGCQIGNRCLIGINATIMDRAKIGNNCIVAGHSIVVEGSEFPENSIIAGVSARKVKTVDNSEANLMNARFYLQNARNYARGIERLSQEELSAVVSGGSE